MLKAKALGFEREGQVIFSNLTFEVEPGSLLMVSGPNGGGKTSLLKVLAGLWCPTTGTLTWRGKALKPLDPNFLAELIYMGHKIAIEPSLTPLQNLRWLLGVTTLQSISRDLLVQALQKVGLEAYQDTPCEALSKGQGQRVALARLWLHPGACWILDEVLNGLDDRGIELLHSQCLAHLQRQGIIIVASHRFLDVKPFKQVELALGSQNV